MWRCSSRSSLEAGVPSLMTKNCGCLGDQTAPGAVVMSGSESQLLGRGHSDVSSESYS